jgi:polar amino acid transport system substrate-binding protein
MRTRPSPFSPKLTFGSPRLKALSPRERRSKISVSAPLTQLFALVCFLLPLCAPAFAQGTPFVPDDFKFGRNEDKSTLRYCVDPRDPEWELAKEIGEDIVSALLLKPKQVVIQDQVVTSGWDALYRHFLADCDINFGFKLIPEGYPGWLALSRAYYNASYVLAVLDPNWKSLADMPVDKPIGTSIASSADFALIKYLEALPADRQWPRFPMGTPQATMKALLDGTVSAALVWGPAAWQVMQADSAYARVRFISPAPLAVTTLGVGAAMLSNDTFLRTSIDRAIASLAADGTIAKIIAAHHFPAEVPK